MANLNRRVNLRVSHKLALVYSLVGLLTLLIALWRPWVAVLFCLLLSVALGWLGSRRLRRALEITEAWLRGHLGLRIADSVSDDFGLLTAQLDVLAAHLKEDEEDLEVLREHNARLTDQVRALAVVEERNRLARELHDSVKQHLFSLTMTASAIRARCGGMRALPEDLAEMLDEIERAAQAAQRETTRLIEDLRPGSVGELGLIRALNDFSLLFGAQEHLLIYLDVEGSDKGLPSLVAEALYRVVQEALHNVVRHARATRVDIILHCLPASVSLRIIDNGVGFDMSTPHTGLGFASMTERLMGVGGRLIVESDLGRGTTVSAEVNLPDRRNALVAGVGAPQYHPDVSSENWAWLGQRLVIPVGQIWPWLPADQRNLRRPLADPIDGPFIAHRDRQLLGFRQVWKLRSAGSGISLVEIYNTANGYGWELEGAFWELRRVRGQQGRAILTFKRQAVAALQYQGRQIRTWTEIHFDDHGYSLVPGRDNLNTLVLYDEGGSTMADLKWSGQNLSVAVQQAIPLPLLAVIAARALDERLALASLEADRDSQP